MKKLLTYLILPVIIIALGYLIVNSINQPVKFNKEKSAREAVAIEQLKDIRTLQVAYKNAYAKFAPTMDSLINFYNNGEMTVLMQIGSNDDSLSVAHTAAVRKGKKLTNLDLYKLYLAGDKNLVFSVANKIPVKDTLFKNREGFNIENLRNIPFAEGDTVIMQEVVKQVSGVNVPLFEACVPYESLLKGMDHQLLVNLKADREDSGRYPGLMVGSVTNPNNNAGNWE